MENPIIRSIKAKGFKIAEQVSNRKKGDWLKFAIIFVSIVITVIAAYLIWNNFLNPEAVQRREQEERYNEFFQALSEGENRQREDIYGGVTPQETLDKFVAALEDGDLELASKYFSLTVEGKTDPKWLTALQKTKEEGKIEEIIAILKNAKEDSVSSINAESHAVFATISNQGIAIGRISFSLNEHSNLWKIESI
jgi:hypothetical protein